MPREIEDEPSGERVDRQPIDALPGIAFAFDLESRELVRGDRETVALRTVGGREYLVGAAEPGGGDRKAYGALFERGFFAIALVGPDGRIAMANEGFRRLAGIEGPDAAGVDLLRLAAPRSAADFDLALRRLYDGSFLRYSFDGELAPPGRRAALVAVEAERIELERFGPLVAFVVEDVTDRVLAERAMAAALAEKEALLQEIRHRVGNNLQIIASLMRLTKGRYVDGVNFAEAVLSRVEAMALLYQSIIEDHGIANIHLGDFIEELMRETRGLYGLREDEFALEARIEDPAAIDGDRIVPVGLLIAESARAFVEEGGSGGRLRICLRRREGCIELEIASRSLRLPAAYYDPLSDESLLLRVLADQLKARLELVDGPEDDEAGWRGSRIVISVPIEAPPL